MKFFSVILLLFLFSTTVFSINVYKIESSQRGLEKLIPYKNNLIKLTPGFLFFSGDVEFDLLLRKNGFTYNKENLFIEKLKKAKLEKLGFQKRKNFYIRKGPNIQDTILILCPFPQAQFSFNFISSITKKYPEKNLYVFKVLPESPYFLTKIKKKIKNILVIGLYEFDRGIWYPESFSKFLNDNPLPRLSGWLVKMFRKPEISNYLHFGFNKRKNMVSTDSIYYNNFLNSILQSIKKSGNPFTFNTPLSTFDNPFFSIHSDDYRIKLVELLDKSTGKFIKLEKVNKNIYSLPEKFFSKIAGRLYYKIKFVLIGAKNQIKTITLPTEPDRNFLFSKRVNRFAVIKSKNTKKIEQFLVSKNINYDLVYPDYFNDIELLQQYSCLICWNSPGEFSQLDAPFLIIGNESRKNKTYEYEKNGLVFFIKDKDYYCNFDFSNISSQENRILEQYIFNSKHEKIKDNFNLLVEKEQKLDNLKPKSKKWISEKNSTLSVKLEIIDFLRELPKKNDIFEIIADTMDFMKNKEISKLSGILDSFESADGLGYIQQTKPLFSFIKKDSKSFESSSDMQIPQIETGGFTTFVSAPEVQVIYRGAKIRNGAIKGRIRTLTGGIPASSIRVQAVKDSMARYSYTDISTGNYFIPDVPLGVWDVRLYSKEFGIPESDDNADTSMKAYVENSSVYIMPDIAVTKMESLLEGAYRGSVSSSGGSLRPISNATIFVADKYGTVSDSNGHFYLSGIPPGKQSAVVQASGYETLKKDIYIVSDQAVSQTFYLIPKEGGLSGHIHPVNYQASVDWSQVHVTVRGVKHEPIVVDRGFFSVQVPIDLGTYTISVYAPYYERVDQTISTTLYEGQVLQFPMIELRRKTTTISFDIFASENTTGSLTVMIGNYQSPLSSNFSGGRTAWIHGMTIPQGLHKIVTYGAQSLTNPHQESKEMEFEITNNRNFSLFVIK